MAGDISNPVIRITSETPGPVFQVQEEGNPSAPSPTSSPSTNPGIQLVRNPPPGGATTSNNLVDWVVKNRPDLIFFQGDPSKGVDSQFTKITAEIPRSSAGGYAWEEEAGPVPKEGENMRPIFLMIKWKMTLKDGTEIEHEEKYVPFGKGSMPKQGRATDEEILSLYKQADLLLHVHKKIIKGPLVPTSPLHETLKQNVHYVAKKKFIAEVPLPDIVHTYSKGVVKLVINPDGIKTELEINILKKTKGDPTKTIYDLIKQRAKLSTRSEGGTVIQEAIGNPLEILDVNGKEIIAKAAEKGIALSSLVGHIGQKVQKQDEKFDQVKDWFIKDDATSKIPLLGRVINGQRRIRNALIGAPVPSFKGFKKEFTQLQKDWEGVNVQVLEQHLKELEGFNNPNPLDLQEIQDTRETLARAREAKASVDQIEWNYNVLEDDFTSKKKSDEQLKAIEEHIGAALLRSLSLGSLEPQVIAIVQKVTKREELSDDERQLLHKAVISHKKTFEEGASVIGTTPQTTAGEGFDTYTAAHSIRNSRLDALLKEKGKILAQLSYRVNEVIGAERGDDDEVPLNPRSGRSRILDRLVS